MRRYFIPTVLMFLFLVQVVIAADREACADFLAAMHTKPTHLEFLGCKRRTDLQGQPLEARYRVSGTHAAAVEHFLVTEFKIKELHRTCCVWESTQNSYRDDRLGLLLISMSTEETTVTSKSQWPKIRYFYVTVARYTEEP